jgi:hypothetical protein
LSDESRLEIEKRWRICWLMAQNLSFLSGLVQIHWEMKVGRILKC